MKALTYRGPRTIAFGDVADPGLSDGRAALVRVTLCGVCGSDLHTYHGETLGAEPGYCLGHEAVGEVVEVGSQVTGVVVGQRVLIPASIGCGRCRPCRRDHVIDCESGIRVYGQGFPGVGGSQAQVVEIPDAQANLVVLPDTISDEVGVLLTDNLPTAWYAARRGRVQSGDTVAVLGLGPVGQLAITAAFAMGAARVIAVDPVAERRALAEQQGALAVAPDAAQATTQDQTSGRGADVVLEAVGGNEATVQTAVDVVRRGGRVSMVGASVRATMPFPIFMATLKSLEFHVGICSVQNELSALLRLLDAGRLSIPPVITHRFRLAEGPAAYALFDSRTDGVGKIVLDPT